MTSPLSVGQEALWFLHRMRPDSSAYHIALAVRIRTPIEASGLAAAVSAVADRHDLLRSAFTEVAGQPRRTVLDRCVVRLDIREVPGLGDDQLHALAYDVTQPPFDLAGGRPFRVVLLRRGPTDAVLVLVAHHLVSDATSQWLLLRDLLRAYHSGQPLPALSENYDDYVRAERELLESARGQRMAERWRQVGAGVSAAALPTDRPRSETRPATGAGYEVRLPGGITGAEAGTTPFAFLLGVFESVLYRCTGMPEFLIATHAAVRSRPATREMVGYLVNTLLLRASFDHHTTFADAGRSAARRTVNGLAMLGYPFALGAAETRTPLFRIAFTMVDTGRVEPPLPMARPGQAEGARIGYAGLDLALVDVPQQEGQCDLSVEVRYGRDSSSAVFRYDAELFDSATVSGLAEGFARFVRVALADPHRTVAGVPLVDQDDLARILAFGTGAKDIERV